MTADKKAAAELAYWQGKKREEGALTNRHYEYFFTTFFGLTKDFYVGKRVLDVGCGPRGSLEWADSVAERVGTDPLSDVYRGLGTQTHGMCYRTWPAEAIEVEDSHFDVVSCFNVLDHVDNLRRAINEMTRVLRKGGLLLLMTDVRQASDAAHPQVLTWDALDMFYGMHALRTARYVKHRKGIYILPGVPAHVQGHIEAMVGKFDMEDARALPADEVGLGVLVAMLRKDTGSVDPDSVVKENSRHAFDYFYSKREYVNEKYLTRKRRALYDTLATRCKCIADSKGQHLIRVADVGCGTGHMLNAIKQHLSASYSVELHGVDFARAGIEWARELLPAATLTVANLHEKVLPADVFDIVLCVEVIEHVKKPREAIVELLRVCHPSGSVIVTVPNGKIDKYDGHVNRWNAQEFRDFLSHVCVADVEVMQDNSWLLARLRKGTE
jgi:ubiquinone/menaquinone biosynthesis C-methylase UbiE